MMKHEGFARRAIGGRRLADILVLHEQWLHGRGGERAYLAGEDLQAKDLRKVDLSIANLSGANLNRANLAGATLREADLSGCDLIGSDLQGADLTSADLSFAKMIKAKLKGAVLSNANMRAVNLTYAKLQEAKLNSVNLEDAQLSDADLSDADLSDANLAHCILDRANLINANLDNVNLEGSFFKSVKVLNADFGTIRNPPPWFVEDLLGARTGYSYIPIPAWEHVLFDLFDSGISVQAKGLARSQEPNLGTIMIAVRADLPKSQPKDIWIWTHHKKWMPLWAIDEVGEWEPQRWASAAGSWKPLILGITT